MSGLDEAEYQKLTDLARRLERGIDAASLPSSALANLAEIKQRMDKLEEAGIFQNSTSEKEKERRANDSIAIAEAVAREHRLDAGEKEQFAGFLHKDFFTKQDIEKLNDFYLNSWDKLTDKGKDEMSKRLWEGIARGEYRFEDLSPEIQKREREHLSQHGLTPEVKEQQVLSEKENTSQTASLSDAASPTEAENGNLDRMNEFTDFGQKPTELAQQTNTNGFDRGLT